jgi:gluconokinase
LNSILAIDIGTTSIKGLLVQPDGKVIGQHQIPCTTFYPKPGYVEQRAEDLLDGVKEVIRKCAQGNAELIRGISFSCAMHSMTAVDSLGQPLLPVMLWADTRSTTQADKLLASSDEADFIYHTTGTPIHPMSPLCKLIWLQENQPDVFTKASRFVSIKEYILFHLTGLWRIDYSLASATGLFDVHQLRWMPEALSKAYVDESRLSICVSPYFTTSVVSKAVADDLCLSMDTPFVWGGSDGCLANLGSGAMQQGELSVTIGTSGAARLTARQFHTDPQKRIFNYRLDEDTFIVGGATNNGSVLLSWFSKQILNEPVDAGALLDRAMKVEAGANGLLFLPYVLGERAPFYNADARGVFFGLGWQHTSEHMLRAVVEGICFEMKTIIDAIEESAGSSNKIIASGGFTQSEQWVQLLADITGKELHVVTANDTSAIGAALMGMKALGMKDHFIKTNTHKIFSPRSEKIYTEHYCLFTHLTSALQDSFKKISSVQN